MRQPVDVRQPAVIRIYVIVALLVLPAVIAGLVSSPVEGPIFVLMAAFGVALVARLSILKLVADESGLFIRNFFGTRRFRWAEVEDFRLGTPPMGMPFAKAIHVLLRNGEVFAVDVSASYWGYFGGKAKREELLKRLHEWLRPQDGLPPPPA